MVRSAESTEPHQVVASRRRRLPLTAGLLAFGLIASGLLSGCNTVAEAFGEDEPEPTRVTTPPEAEGEQEFPNLATVPNAPPETSTAAERATLREGLAADRDNADYTDEKLGSQGTAPAEPTPAQQSAAAPSAAQPEPESIPAPAPADGTLAAQPAAPTPTPTPQPAPAPTAAAQSVQAAPPPAPAEVPSEVPSVAQGQVLENGSVIVNPDAVLGGGPPASSRLVPSGESRPVALIFFRHGSAGLARADVAVLREVVRLHQERGGLIRVIGHASQGATSRNVAQQQLANFNISLARANAVARELVRLGVPPDRVQVAAAGAQQPLYYETQPTGEAGNRRVEIYLDY